jgi:hypothetical protein
MGPSGPTLTRKELRAKQQWYRRVPGQLELALPIIGNVTTSGIAPVYPYSYLFVQYCYPSAPADYSFTLNAHVDDQGYCLVAGAERRVPPSAEAAADLIRGAGYRG